MRSAPHVRRWAAGHAGGWGAAPWGVADLPGYASDPTAQGCPRGECHAQVGLHDTDVVSDAKAVTRDRMVSVWSDLDYG